METPLKAYKSSRCFTLRCSALEIEGTNAILKNVLLHFLKEDKINVLKLFFYIQQPQNDILDHNILF